MTGSPSEREPSLISLADGEVYCWLEQQSSVMLKAVTRPGDPVELTADEARELAAALAKMADQID